MSTLIVEVCEVKSVNPHPNADRLDIATIKGWNVIVQKDLVKAGQPVVYFPPDSVMPFELAERLGITKYLSPVRGDGENGERQTIGYRVRAARLRGEPSYGTIDHVVPDGFKIGDDLKEHFGVFKYEPPMKTTDGDAEKPNHNFHAYTDIENLRNFPDILRDGEEVVVTEKLHGKNCAVGLICDRSDETGEPEFKFMARSHSVRRKEFDHRGNRSDYWLPLNDDVRWMLDSLSDGMHDVIMYGEIIGSGVQDMCYGFQNGQKTFRAFDLVVNGCYLSADEKAMLFAHFGIEAVPLLYRGPFSHAKIEELTYGPTTICDPSKAGKFKGREGIVITPVVERTHLAVGRVILKSVSADYLARSGGTEGH